MRTLLLFGAIALSILNSCSFETVKIGNLEVMTEDLGEMDWEGAKKACADLGDGWRLPTKDELMILYENKDKIGGFAGNYYWCSKEFDVNSGWIKYFEDDGPNVDYDPDFHGVRAVRTF